MRSRLLIVDDDPDLLVILPDAIQLRLPDSVIDTAPSADKALEQIKTVDYDAIITDIKMPGMDGLALMQEIRKIRPSTPTLLRRVCLYPESSEPGVLVAWFKRDRAATGQPSVGTHETHFHILPDEAFEAID
jgi:CheY-like chemotaxis protein